MKTKFAKLLATAATCAAFSGAAYADLTNPGFETGNMNGWTTVGNVSAVTSFFFDDSTSPNNPTAYSTTVTPLEGSYMAQLTTGGSIPSISLQGSTASSAPMILWYRFVTRDYMPFNDALTLQYSTLTNPSPMTVNILDVDGYDPDSGWKSFILPTGTTYVNFQLQNSTDGNVNSYGFIDIAPIPEPGEWALMLAGLGLIGMMVRRRSVSRAV